MLVRMAHVSVGEPYFKIEQFFDLPQHDSPPFEFAPRVRGIVRGAHFGRVLTGDDA
jgi:hypothetical protein